MAFGAAMRSSAATLHALHVPTATIIPARSTFAIRRRMPCDSRRALGETAGGALSAACMACSFVQPRCLDEHPGRDGLGSMDSAWPKRQQPMWSSWSGVLPELGHASQHRLATFL